MVNPDSELLEVNAIAYHLNDSLSMTFLEIKNENLLYKRPDTTKAFYAEVRVSYKLLSEPNSRVILDSGSFYLNDRAGEENVQVKSVYAKFRLKAFLGTNYYLDIRVFDLNKKTKYSKGLNVYKYNKLTEQNYLIRHKDQIAFKNNFLKDDELSISCANSALSKITVDCFFKDFGPALPPFSSKIPDEFKYKPDSVFETPFTNGEFKITMPEKGFYHIISDSKKNEGLTLYTYDITFPGVSNSDDMINATRYIMNREEFENCKESNEQKSCIEQFWLNIGGSNERARELLKRYYGRVKEANKYYTSYAQGWKSDRGMIYIVFGPPTNTYRSKEDEIWVYGNEANPSTLRFIFNKTQNPFTDNDFVLERSPFFKEAYYTAVDYWRQGVVYMDSKK